MSISTWIINKFAAPLVPILVQTYKVAIAIDGALADVLKVIVVGTPTYDNVKSVSDAVAGIKSAVAKAIVFLGGIIPTTATATSNLKDELDKLRKLL
jgi:hypothetical protein